MGTSMWEYPVNVTQSSGDISLELRITDRSGNVSDPKPLTFAVDTVPPLLTFDLPNILTGTIALLGGTTADPAPIDAAVQFVEVMNEAEGYWQPALTYDLLNGSQNWRLLWELPEADYEQHRLKARAIDYAGNVTELPWQTTIIDTVGPQITVTVVLTEVLLADYMIYNWPERTPLPVLSGVVTDGGGVNSLSVKISTPDGTTFNQDVSMEADGSFDIIPALTIPIPGLYNLTIEARDIAGNLSSLGIFEVDFVNSPPDCTNAAPSIEIIWPPDSSFSMVDILGVTDPDGHIPLITIDSIFQDEPVLGPGGSTPDGTGVGTSTAGLRAERLGNGNGRVYHVAFMADDGWGGVCTTTVTVSVPRSPNIPAVDDGPLYNSTGQ